MLPLPPMVASLKLQDVITTRILMLTLTNLTRTSLIFLHSFVFVCVSVCSVLYHFITCICLHIHYLNQDTDTSIQKDQ
jgi:hypothetical protein